MNGKRVGRPATRLLTAALASCLALGAAPAMAQSTGAAIRGQVMVDSTPAGDAQLVVVNPATGLRRTVQANADGRYYVGGLPPGTYRIEVQADGRTATRELTVQVGQTATLNLGVGGMAETAAPGEATTLDAVQVVGTAVETKTSEVATYITNKQIELLPQGTRNFLAFADTVPGMAFEQNPADGSTRQARSRLNGSMMARSLCRSTTSASWRFPKALPNPSRSCCSVTGRQATSRLAPTCRSSNST